MPETRHQLNLKPEHYIIYIQIKEEKDKEYMHDGNSLGDSVLPNHGQEIRDISTHGWCPSKQIAHQCDSLHLNDELLVNTPGFVEQYDGGLRPSRHKTWSSLFLKRKKKKNSDKTDEDLAQS